jgi:hypothetical protein
LTFRSLLQFGEYFLVIFATTGIDDLRDLILNRGTEDDRDPVHHLLEEQGVQL